MIKNTLQATGIALVLSFGMISDAKAALVDYTITLISEGANFVTGSFQVDGDELAALPQIGFGFDLGLSNFDMVIGGVRFDQINTPGNGVTFDGEIIGICCQTLTASGTLGPSLRLNTSTGLPSSWSTSGLTGGNFAGSTYVIAPGSLTPVPLPAALPLLLVGVGGLTVMRCRRRS
jgi:hypothetical protein